MTRPRVGERRRREVRSQAVLVLSRVRLMTMMELSSVLRWFLVGTPLLALVAWDGCWGLGRFR